MLKPDNDTISQLAEKVLLMMSQHGIPLYPENYWVWFHYAVGVDKDLKEDINRVIKTVKFSPKRSIANSSGSIRRWKRSQAP